MNKNDLIDAIAADADLSKASAGRAVDAAISAITGTLHGRQCLFGWLWNFLRESASGVQGRNPRTGETIQIAARARLDSKRVRRSRMPLISN